MSSMTERKEEKIVQEIASFLRCNIYDPINIYHFNKMDILAENLWKKLVKDERNLAKIQPLENNFCQENSISK